MRIARALLVLCLVAPSLRLVAQSEDAVVKREAERIAALNSGQRREQYYGRDYININPPGQLTVGFQPGVPDRQLYTKDVKVIIATQNGAVTTMLQGPRPKTSQMPSATDPDRALDVWANEQGTWRLVARQAVWVLPPNATAAPSRRVKVPAIAPYQPKNAAEGEILKANEAIEDAFRRHDGSAYERLTIPQFVRIGARGQLMPRAEWIKTAIQENKDTDLVPPLIDEVRIRVYGDVAVMTFKPIGRDKAGTTPVQGQRVMRAWVKQNDGWKLGATISTNIWQGEKAQ
jgi:hypothetical protein